MELSIAVGALTFYPLDTTLAIAHDAGVEHVEVLLSPRTIRSGGSTIAARAARAGVSVTTAHAVLALRPQSLDRKIEVDVASIKAAAEIDGCRSIVLHTPISDTGGSAPVQRWLDAIAEARERSRPSLALALENRAQNWDGTPAQRLDDVRYLAAVAGEWDMHVCLDLAHAASFNLYLPGVIETLRSRLINVHLSDANRLRYRGGLLNGLFRDHAMPGHGVLPLDDALSLLIERDYRGPLTLELSPVSLRAWLPGAPRRRLRAAVEDVRQRLAWLSAGTETPLTHPHRTV